MFKKDHTYFIFDKYEKSHIFDNPFTKNITIESIKKDPDYYDVRKDCDDR